MKSLQVSERWLEQVLTLAHDLAEAAWPVPEGKGREKSSKEGGRQGKRIRTEKPTTIVIKSFLVFIFSS